MAANGSPAPLFETDDDRCAYVIRLPVHPLAEQAAGQVTPQVTPQVVHLIEILTGEMSRGDLMERVGLKDRMNFSHHYLIPALESKLVEMTLPDKPRSSKQRYRLSKLGQQWLQANADESSQ